MLRRFVAVSLFVSFVAMATSGLMMFVVERPSFTIQMHPVHKLFGLLMVTLVLLHLGLNYRSLLAYLRARSVAAVGGLLAIVLVLLYGVALNNPVPEDIAGPLDELAAEAESHE